MKVIQMETILEILSLLGFDASSASKQLTNINDGIVRFMRPWRVVSVLHLNTCTDLLHNKVTSFHNINLFPL
jgi:hypothetical protein